jgi:integrase
MAFAMISCFVYKINWGVRRNLDSLAFSWEQRKLNEVGVVIDPHPSHRAPKEEQGGIPFIGIGDVDEMGNINRESARPVPENVYDEHHKRYDLNVPSLGLGRVASLGKVIRLRSDIGKYAISPTISVLQFSENINIDYLYAYMNTPQFKKQFEGKSNGSTRQSVGTEMVRLLNLSMPFNLDEQKAIGTFYKNLDNLITLHQRKHYLILEDIMLNNINKMDLFYDYYAQWITVYKEGAIRKVTMDKYLLTQSWIKQLAPELRVCELSRITYQKLLNDYAKSHERQTTMDFHHQLKGAVLDAVDEGLIERDPTRKAIIKGKKPRHKKIKYLNQFELHKLLSNLDLGQEINWDWFILLVAKTGMRFSEALAITPKDFDFSKQSLSINKTWDYKGEGGFMPTKNQSSIRKIQIDWQLIIQFSTLVKDLPEDEPIFVSGKVYNSTVNDILERHCKKAEIPVISIHGLRHTHASLLLFAGVSIASVAQRLGHSSMTTTQKTYLHIIQELENKDVDLVMRSLSSLN